MTRLSLSKRILMIGICAWIPGLPGYAEVEHPSSTGDELHFLTKPPKKAPHRHSTHITISEETLKTGWVQNKQCHYNLAQVSALEVVFRKGGVRNLQIARADNIKKAWVEKHSVQLTDVGKDAVLCIVSETQSFKVDTLDGTYTWRGGPYMKRFLDGYFPMQVNLAVDFPPHKLKLISMDPAALKSRSVNFSGHIRLDTMFVGKLVILLKFQPIDKKNTLGW